MTRRLKRPPGRASNVGGSVQRAWSGGKNHRATAFGSVHKPKTLSRGAANVRSSRSEMPINVFLRHSGRKDRTVAKSKIAPTATYFPKRFIETILLPAIEVHLG